MGDPYPNQVAYYGILVINYVITLEIVENRQSHPPGRVAVYETVPGCAPTNGMTYFTDTFDVDNCKYWPCFSAWIQC